MWTDVEGFGQNCPRQGRRLEHCNWGHGRSAAWWRATEAETVVTVQWCLRMGMTGGDAVDVPSGLSLFDRAALALLSPCSPQAPELQHHGQCWSGWVLGTTHTKTYSHDVDMKALWSQPSPLTYNDPNSSLEPVRAEKSHLILDLNLWPSTLHYDHDAVGAWFSGHLRW